MLQRVDGAGSAAVEVLVSRTLKADDPPASFESGGKEGVLQLHVQDAADRCKDLTSDRKALNPNP